MSKRATSSWTTDEHPDHHRPAGRRPINRLIDALDEQTPQVVD